MNRIVMLKLEDCKCETCFKYAKASLECRNKSSVIDYDGCFPPTRPELWCCEGLWRDYNGRIWTWEQILRGENVKGEF